MSTALFEVAMNIETRKSEIDRLIGGARSFVKSNSEMHDTLCRACTVFLASHLEGFVKDATSSLVLDFNYNISSFAGMPQAVQRTFCKQIAYYEGVLEKDIETRIGQLRSFFSKNSVPIDLNAFSYKESPNRNPSSKVLEAAFEKIGISKILSSVGYSSFEVVFDNDIRADYILVRDLKKLRSLLYRFPYRAPPKKYQFYRRKQPKETLWHSFIEEILSRRHQIAHGDTLSNVADIETLTSDATKLYVLMHALLYSVADIFSEKK